MRGKQVSPPTPFRKGALGSRLEGTTQTAGINPAYLVTSPDCNAGETGFPPDPLPQRCVGESLGRDNSDGRNQSGLSCDVSGLVPSSLRVVRTSATDDAETFSPGKGPGRAPVCDLRDPPAHSRCCSRSAL